MTRHTGLHSLAIGLLLLVGGSGRVQEVKLAQEAARALTKLKVELIIDEENLSRPVIGAKLGVVVQGTTSKDYSPLKHLKQLKRVEFSGGAITDEFLELISEAQNLESVKVLQCDITDAGLKHLRDLTKLKELDLGVCYKVTDEGIKHLAKLDRLEVLTLGHTKVTGKTFGLLKKLGRLRELSLQGSRFTDEGCAQLKTLKGIQFLYLYANFRVTDNGLEHLRALPNLRVLDVTMTDVTDSAVRDFQKARPDVSVTN